jgi:hypothetical protein
MLNNQSQDVLEASTITLPQILTQFANEGAKMPAPNNPQTFHQASHPFNHLDASGMDDVNFGLCDAADNSTNQI